MASNRKSFFLGALMGAAATLCVGGVSRFIPVIEAQGGQAPAQHAGKVVLENDRVRVKDVTFPPGVLDTGTHTHEYAHVGVILTKGALVFTEPGKAGETVQFEAGSVGFREAKATHQVANPGTAPMRVIEVEIK